MKRLISFFILSIFILSSFFALAVPPPELYRVDSRHPNIVFEEGFRTWAEISGNPPNYELLPHVFANSQRNQTDGLVSTTRRYSSVMRSAEIRAQTGSIVQWIYTIIPNDSFYDVNQSLLNAAISPPPNGSEDMAVQNQSSTALLSVSWEEEFASLGNISRDQIHSAQEVTWTPDGNGGYQLVLGQYRRNTYFQPLRPSVNPNNLIPTVTVPPLEDILFEGDLDDFVMGAEPGQCNSPPSPSPSKESNKCTTMTYSEFSQKIKNISIKRQLSILFNKSRFKTTDSPIL